MRYLILLNLIWLALMLMFGEARAESSYGNSVAVKVLLGEAESQGYEGMYLVACALRNKGDLKGVYGHKAIIVKNGVYWRVNGSRTWKISPSSVIQAQKAWNDSLGGFDPTFGATIWQSREDLAVTKMNMDKLILTREYESQYFFREVK